ncbi:MAG: hypothetical protein ABSE00_04995 [Chitinispirillaceae bacterium]
MICIHRSRFQAVFSHLVSLWPIAFYSLCIYDFSRILIKTLQLGHFTVSTIKEAIAEFIFVTIFCAIPFMFFIRIFPKEISVEEKNEMVTLKPYFLKPVTMKISEGRVLMEYGSFFNINDWFSLIFFWRYGLIIIGLQQYTNSVDLVDKFRKQNIVP